MYINGAVASAPAVEGIAHTVREQDWLQLGEQLSGVDDPPSDYAVGELIRGFRHTRQETKRTRILALTAAVFAVVGAVATREAVTARLATIEANKQHEAAEGSRRKLLASKAESLAEAGDGTAAMLVALEGLIDPVRGNDMETGADRTARAALLRALYSGLYARREMAVLASGPKGLSAVAILANAEKVAVGSIDGAVLIFSLSGETVTLTPQSGKISSLSFSPDGSRLLTATDDGTAQQWDVVSGQPVGEAMRHIGKVAVARYDSAARHIVTAGADISHGSGTRKTVDKSGACSITAQCAMRGSVPTIS